MPEGGANVTEVLQLVATASVVPQVLVKLYPPLPVPLSVTLPMLSAAVPEFVNVTI